MLDKHALLIIKQTTNLLIIKQTTNRLQW